MSQREVSSLSGKKQHRGTSVAAPLTTTTTTMARASTGFGNTEKQEDANSFGKNRYVPWLTWNEWNFVRESLYSSSPEAIDSALKRVAAWRTRGCMPVTIEATAAFVEIQQKDPFYRKGFTDGMEKSDDVLSMLYTMAIMRLVNGVIEKTRDEKYVSIAEAADVIGLPRMLVDIRHEGSHRDLPSIKLARLASVKALDWLKYFYWEPQRIGLPQKDKDVAGARKEIQTKLRELAFLEVKEKRSKKEIKKSLNILADFYSSYPSEVVSVILDFLLKALANGKDAIALSNSQLEPNTENIKVFTGTTDVWKLVIEKFICKQPELLLTLLKGILEMIETLGTKTPGSGDQLTSSQYKAKIDKIEFLSNLVTKLVKFYLNNCKKGNSSLFRNKVRETSVEEPFATLKPTVAELLRVYLLAISPGNYQLLVSGGVLTRLLGNDLMSEQLNKIYTRVQTCNLSEKCSTSSDLESLLSKQEKHIDEAVKNLELLKQRSADVDNLKMPRQKSDNEENGSTWTVAKSWNSCPIGMLPSALGMWGVLPDLDRDINMHDNEKASEDQKGQELCTCAKRKDYSADAEIIEDSAVAKKRKTVLDKEMVVVEEKEKEMDRQEWKGHLMIDGTWKKVKDEDIFGIASAIRILV